jgi:predicted HicB family RNase H-like nuclease
MKTNKITMSYDGYQSMVEFDQETGLFHGEVTGLRDVITFQGLSIEELQRALKESVEDYLAYCRQRGEKPSRPSKQAANR